jgi:hypothetical protein
LTAENEIVLGRPGGPAAQTAQPNGFSCAVTIPVAWKKIPYRGRGRFGYAGKSGWM